MHRNYKDLIQALKYHKETDENNCRKCPYNRNFCSFNLASDALEVIENQAKAIETLKNKFKNFNEKRDIELHARLTAEAKTEGRKELAERLKEKAFIHEIPFEANEDKYIKLVEVKEIDNVLKEMEGVENG